MVGDRISEKELVHRQHIQNYVLRKEDFDNFVNEVRAEYDFIAPVTGEKTKQVSTSFFTKIKDPKQIYLDKKTYYPVKGFFFHPEETIFEFRGNKIINPVIALKQSVFFGLRRCDLNSIWHQDIVFLEENEDPFYKARRDLSILLGLHCKIGDDYCFCNSMQLKDYFDLMFYDRGEAYAIEVGSEKGEGFIQHLHEFFTPTDDTITEEEKKTINKKHLKTVDIGKDYNSEAWKKGAEICIACGACTFLCPNCHCFTIEDEIGFDLKTGKRIREPASCQLRHFTRVAGEHIFRDTKLARFKHRIYHQIQYFKERHDVVFCTGCGRCIEGCPVRIDWVEIINEMKE
jgi:sulfhydrogenase subunit beta (sulfur reductase)